MKHKYTALVILSCVTDMKTFDEIMEKNNTFYLYNGDTSFCFQIIEKA